MQQPCKASISYPCSKNLCLNCLVSWCLVNSVQLVEIFGEGKTGQKPNEPLYVFFLLGTGFLPSKHLAVEWANCLFSSCDGAETCQCAAHTRVKSSQTHTPTFTAQMVIARGGIRCFRCCKPWLAVAPHRCTPPPVSHWESRGGIKSKRNCYLSWSGNHWLVSPI